MGDRDWLTPVALLTAQLVAALALILISPEVRLPPLFDTARLAALCMTAAIGWLVISSRLPLAEALEVQMPRIRTVAYGGLLLTVQFTMLTWFKTMLPLRDGFWADPLLANLDGALGVEPWQIALMVPGSEFIQWAYGFWLVVMPFAVFAVLCAKPSILQRRAIASLFMVVAAGSLGQFILPSAGPLFYDLAGHGDRFAPYVEGGMAEARYWLWHFHEQETVKAALGISAFPSMHVALTAWLCLVLKDYSPRLQAVGRLYLAVIWFGSVQTGLHYAVDGLAGVIIAAVAWKLSYPSISIANQEASA